MSETKKLIGAGVSSALANLLETAPAIQDEQAQAAAYLEQFRGVRIVDAETYRSAKTYASEIRARRLELDKRFTGATSALKLLVKEYDKQSIELLQTYKAAEEALRAEIRRVDDEKQAEKEAAERAKLQRFHERTDQLFSVGYAYNGNVYTCGAVFLSPEQIDNLDDEAFSAAIEQGRREAERLAAILAAAEVKQAAQVEVVLMVTEEEETPPTPPQAPTPPAAQNADWFAAPPPTPVPDDFFSKPQMPSLPSYVLPPK